MHHDHLPVAQRERVSAALHGEAIDRPAIGEIIFDDDLVRQALGLETKAAVPLAARRALLQRLCHDLVTVPVPSEGGDLETALFTLKYWQQDSELFVFACIPGPLGDLLKAWGWRNLEQRAAHEPEQAGQIVADAVLERSLLLPQIAAAGADGLVIQDELAQARRLALSPDQLRPIYFPYLTVLVTQAQAAGLPVMLSSPGDLRPVLPDLVDTGINGLHGLDPALGLTPALISEGSQGTLCPWGGFDPAWLALADNEEGSIQEAHLTRLVRAWGRNLHNAPAIFGFWSGVNGSLPVHLLEALYQTVQHMRY